VEDAVSFEIFLGCYRDGNSAGLPLLKVKSLFPVVSEEPESTCWTVHFDALNQSDLYFTPHGLDEVEIEGLTISRPCADPRLWDAILSVMQMGNVIAYWPDCDQPAAATETVIDHLPAEMLDALGKPLVVHTAQELHVAITGSTH
jgi:hypothetical protein